MMMAISSTITTQTSCCHSHTAAAATRHLEDRRPRELHRHALRWPGIARRHRRTILRPRTRHVTVLAVFPFVQDLRRAAAVDGVSFRFAPGEIVGLLGPNGAGKTTTINMILGVLAADAGTIVIEGIDLATHRRQALAAHQLRRRLRAPARQPDRRQNLRVFGMIYGVTELSARIDELLEEFDLQRFRKTKCGVLSSGEQTRVALAKAMLNRPRLLLLDEPTASLDPATARDIRAPHSRLRRAAARRRAVDLPQHVRGGGGLRPRAVPLARQDPAGGRSAARCPREHGAGTLEELFIAVAREPLALSDRDA